jgi:pantothenate kinase
MPQVPDIPEPYRQRVEALLASGQRKLLGLVGPPGSGKSTLATALHRAFSQRSQIIPMDGYHLANIELKRLGRAARKGAPDTFDSAGYVALLTRLRSQPEGETVYAPEFRRELEEPIAGAIPIAPDTQLLITEGNYLLHSEGHWSKVAGLLDEVWYVDVDDNLRCERLVKRHQSFGRSHQAAVDWVANTDEPNARLIAAARGKAHVQFRWTKD